MALRMGGEAPHLGLILTKGSLGGYSVERDLSRSSNDRGDVILHPTPAVLNPGESFIIEWKPILITGVPLQGMLAGFGIASVEMKGICGWQKGAG